MGWLGNPRSRCSFASWGSGGSAAALRRAADFRVEPLRALSSTSANIISTIDRFIALQMRVHGKWSVMVTLSAPPLQQCLLTRLVLVTVVSFLKQNFELTKGALTSWHPY